jgi:hypothetical protein
VSTIANLPSDRQRVLQEEVAAQVTRVLHDNEMDAVSGGAHAACTNNLKQLSLACHNYGSSTF